MYLSAVRKLSKWEQKMTICQITKSLSAPSFKLPIAFSAEYLQVLKKWHSFRCTVIIIHIAINLYCF